MTLGYRAVLRLPENADAVEVAEQQMRSWLDSKRKSDRRRFGSLTNADWKGQGCHETGPGSHLDVVHHTGQDGSRRRLLRHVEVSADGTWTVSMVAASLANTPRNAQSIIIELDVGERDADEAVTAGAAPNLVTNVLEAIDVRDGETDLFAKPRIVKAHEVPFLVEQIKDQTRNVAVVVAGAIHGADVDPWQRAVESLLKESRGVATGFVLTQAAQSVLDNVLPDSHAVQASSIRTFAPEVDLDDPIDGLRHRVLSARTMERNLKRTPNGRLQVREYLQKSHARTSRKRFLDRPLPADLARTLRILSREEILENASTQTLEPQGSAPALPFEIPGHADQPELFDTSTIVSPPRPKYPRPRPAPRLEPLPFETVDDPEQSDREAGEPDIVQVGVAEYRRLCGLLVGLGAEADLTDAHLEVAEHTVRRLRGDAEASEAYLNEAERLERERDDAKADAALQEMYTVDEAEARREAQHEAAALRRQVKYLRQRLLSLEQYDVYDYAEEHEELARPDDIAGLCELLHPTEGEPQLTQFVVFTGDEKAARDVDDRDNRKRYLGDIWEQVLVLYDYARTQYPGSLQQYLTDEQVTTRKVTERRYANGESDSTVGNAKKRDIRWFPVPAEVHVDKGVHTYAHFKPPRADMFAPRVHIYDDTKNTGRVYVGYIGKHLPTTTKGN